MAVQNSLAKQKKSNGLTAYLTQDAVKNQINSVIGGKNGDRFISSIVSAVNTNQELQSCTNQSILSAALLGNSLGLSPSPQLGQYYMVPFNDKTKGKVAQFQLGYKGYLQLAMRSGQYKKLNVLAIKNGELVRYDPLNEEIEVNLIEDDTVRENTETIGYYAMFEYTNGFKKTLYWSKKKMEEHALKYSQAYAADKRKGTAHTFWVKDFDSMAYKTMLRQLISKWGIMSIDMMTAFDKDMAVINQDGSSYYVDNQEDEINEDTVIDAVPDDVGEYSTEQEEGNEVKEEPEANTASKNNIQNSLFGD
jgi:recombinase, phage recT family|nr:MAG TPA: RecT protein [Caudoviricetes sp.]